MTDDVTMGMPSYTEDEASWPAWAKWEMSEKINDLAAALSKAQGEMEGARKDTENPFFKSKYADLAACIAAARDPLTSHGLSVTQLPTALPDGSAALVTMLMHESGQWLRGIMPLRPSKEGEQPFGSCYTYMRRYSYAGVVGLAQVDDDAESATIRMSPQKRTKTIKAMADAAAKDDNSGLLEVWDELEKEEQEALWLVLRSDERSNYKKRIAAARALADPNYIAPLGDPLSEKDARRQTVRNGP